MIEIHLLTLNDHPPSDVARKTASFWLDDLPGITVTETKISTRTELLYAKQRYKFVNLPCLIINDLAKKAKAEKYYHDDIRAQAKKLKDERPSEKKRRMSGQKISKTVRDINDG